MKLGAVWLIAQIVFWISYLITQIGVSMDAYVVGWNHVLIMIVIIASIAMPAFLAGRDSVK
ncbi:MAG: hypothetical protein PHF86_15145 [Candidatus Nanoarchaeia archaeon]|nr:hypothetical protein [Candidatus Nanoarchaeia archaeon]